MPEITISDVKLPDDLIERLPNLDLRERLADVDLSNMHLPAALREVDFSDLRLPEFRLPDVDVAALTRQVRPEPRRRNLLPWLVVAGAATLFAGWFLATSSMTARKVRSAAGKVRSKIDDMRGANTDVIDLDESSTTLWSGDSDWQTGSTGGTGMDDAHRVGDADVIDADATLAADADAGGWSTPAAASQSLADASAGTGFEGESMGSGRADAAAREG